MLVRESVDVVTIAIDSALAATDPIVSGEGGKMPTARIVSSAAS